jgi:hypothetical protein
MVLHGGGGGARQIMSFTGFNAIAAGKALSCSIRRALTAAGTMAAV